MLSFLIVKEDKTQQNIPLWTQEGDHHADDTTKTANKAQAASSDEDEIKQKQTGAHRRHTAGHGTTWGAVMTRANDRSVPMHGKERPRERERERETDRQLERERARQKQTELERERE